MIMIKNYFYHNRFCITLKIIILNIVEFVFHAKYITKYLYLFFEKNSNKKLTYTHRYYKNYIENNKIFFYFIYILTICKNNHGY